MRKINYVGNVENFWEFYKFEFCDLALLVKSCALNFMSCGFYKLTIADLSIVSLGFVG